MALIYNILADIRMDEIVVDFINITLRIRIAGRKKVVGGFRDDYGRK